MPEYRELVEYIVRSLVDHPDNVDVSESGRGRSPRIEVRLHPDDVGRVIGKSGRNIEAVRALVKAAAIRDHRRVSVEVVTDDSPGGDHADHEHSAEGEEGTAEPAAELESVGMEAAGEEPVGEALGTEPAPAGAAQETEPEA